MFKRENELFHLCTEKTSYIFRVEPAGHLEHLHYGARITLSAMSEQAMKQKHSSLPSATICYSPDTPTLSMELLRGEISSTGKGDYGDPFLCLTFADGSRTSDFVFESYEVKDEKPTLSGMPCALPPSCHDDQTLHVILKEACRPTLRLHLFYTAYSAENVITRRAVLENGTGETVVINKLLSSQLDFEDSDYIMTSFHGSWTNEMNRSETPCSGKNIVNETRLGFSSNRANPFVMLSRPDATETSGEIYASNLIYSGNHYECAQSGELARLRFSTGIHPEGFSWLLKSGESFETPEAALCYSAEGFGGVSRCFHRFVRKYIIRGIWANKARPVLINSWEAAYFDFDENRILSIAKQAKQLGVELLVLDDGWFGRRNSTKTSMGDWTANPEKLPHGVRGLADRIHDMGMQFGIWVEPEAVSVNSDLFRAHPDWCLAIPGMPNSEGRSERLLDFANPDVVDYIYKALCSVFEQHVDYVKWDMNRGMSDCYSPHLSPEQQGETGHRFILGLYDLLERLVKRFPCILFESCASGGNRADLGMLSYMPQFWASDNSDALCRMKIQTNYSYGYPLSALGCHVSSVPNHQTLRETPISTRYEVASFGALGYELDPCRLSEDDLEDISGQIEHYKLMRDWTLNADLYRLKSGSGGYYSLMLVNEAKTSAAVMTFQEIYRSGRPMYVLRTDGLDPDRTYHLQSRPCTMNIKPMSGRFVTIDSLSKPYFRHKRETEDYVLSGSFLNHSGIRLKSDFNGHNLDEDTRYYPDYASRFYNLTAVE